MFGISGMSTRSETGFANPGIRAPSRPRSAVRAARHAHTVMTFRINANGSISSIRVAQSSGNSSMGYSAIRALQSIDAFGPCPNRTNQAC